MAIHLSKDTISLEKHSYWENTQVNIVWIWQCGGKKQTNMTLLEASEGGYKSLFTKASWASIHIRLSSPFTILAFLVNDFHDSNVSRRFPANAWIILSFIITFILIHTRWSLIFVDNNSSLTISKYSKSMKKRLVCFLYFKNISLAFNHTRCGCQKMTEKVKLQTFYRRKCREQ